MAWILRLVKIGAEGDGHCTDVMEINRPDDLGDIADLGLTLAEGKLLLAGIQREIVAAQAGDHAVQRPDCLRCGGVCRVKDYRDHAVATLFGQVTVRLPRFRCAACGAVEVGVGWPSHCRSTPELDQLRAHLSALMSYRTAADILEQLFPVGAGKDKETMRRHTLKAGAAIRDCATMRPETDRAGDHDHSGFHLHPQLPGRRTSPGGASWQCRNSVWRPPGFWRCRRIRHGHQNADPPKPRGRRPNGRHCVDGLHRWLCWPSTHSGRRRPRRTAYARLVPYRNETSASEANCQRSVDRRPGADGSEGCDRRGDRAIALAHLEWKSQKWPPRCLAWVEAGEPLPAVTARTT